MIDLAKKYFYKKSNFHIFTVVDFVKMGYFLYSKAEHHLKNIEVIEEFPCIREFGHERYGNIRPTSLQLHYNKGIEFCYVKKGRYDWQVEGRQYSVYPGQAFVTCPWELHGSSKGVVDLGEIYWLIITPEVFTDKGKFHLGRWSSFSKEQERIIGGILADNTNPIFNRGAVFEKIIVALEAEVTNQKLGYQNRVNSLIEEIILEAVRAIQSRELEAERETQWIDQLETLLCDNLSLKWSIEDMAAAFGLGTTSFNDKVKRLTGYTPSSYLINLRVNKAKELLEKPALKLTEIGLECGFYSSQHFSSTFLKRTGINTKSI